MPEMAAVSSEPTRPLSQNTALGIRKWGCRSGSPGAVFSRFGWCRVLPLQLDDVALPDADHDAACRVMGEFQPRQMAGLGAILTVAPDAGLPDIRADRRHGLAGGFDGPVQPLRLLDRIGEAPCDRHGLVRRGTEFIRADRVAQVAL